MAETYQRVALTLATVTVTGTGATLYTCPTSVSAAIIVGSQIANIDGSNSAVVDFCLDVGGAGTYRYYVKDLTVATGVAISPLNDRHVLEPNDRLAARADTSSGADIILSLLEIT